MGDKAVINDNVSSHNLTHLCTLILKQTLISIVDQIDPPWQTANIFKVKVQGFFICHIIVIQGITRSEMQSNQVRSVDSAKQ